MRSDTVTGSRDAARLEVGQGQRVRQRRGQLHPTGGSLRLSEA